MEPSAVISSLVCGGVAVLVGALTVLAARAWKGERFLCDDCLYNDPQLCRKPERPRALQCLAYKGK